MLGQIFTRVRRSFGRGLLPSGAQPLRGVLSCIVVLVGTSGLARAQDAASAAAGERAPTAGPRITEPVLTYFASPVYPPEARAAGEEADVVLHITIDSRGYVTDAEVVGSASPAFDAAALEAVQAFIFEPAMRDGAPIAAKIAYAFPFRLPTSDADEAPRVTYRAPQETNDAPRAPASAAETEVVVRGLSVAERMNQSAEAVHVVETTRARREAADLGQVVARSPGVVVRRSGGLGSDSRFTLNGLSGDQVRYFLDGIPLEQAGYPLGVANVPVNLIERVELYRGVVPIRFGADALGGAVNLVTRQGLRGTHGFASYEFGSFHTYRMTVGAQSSDEPTGIVVRGDGFYDYARNDYPVDVEVTGDDGRLTPATVRRFHDAYRATGGSLEAGFVGRPWARRLLLRLFATDYDRDVQHNRSMTRVFGEMTDGQSRAGATLRYENSWDDGLSFEAYGTYSQGAFEFRDVSSCNYDWYGECPIVRRSVGELDGTPYDRRVNERALLGRVSLSHESEDGGRTLRLSVSPSLVSREGEEQALASGARRDPFGGESRLGTVVTGLEYEVNLLGDRLENVVFVKDYFQSQHAIEPLVTGHDAEHDKTVHTFGWGDGLRYRFSDQVYAKVSYELATRLPKPNEVYGDASLVLPNFDLQPEVSHNGNVSLAAPSIPTGVGEFRVDVGGFVRDVHDQIFQMQGVTTAMYENVADARFLGVESAVGWTSPFDYLSLDANVTVQDARNTSTDGPYRLFEGDRLPNQPYLFGNGVARFALRDLAMAKDELSVVWNSRYVHEFYLSWEKYGNRGSKFVVDSQLLHSLGLTYLIRHGELSLSSTLEVQNLTDAVAQDYYGVQKPGRAFFFKSVAEL